MASTSIVGGLVRPAPATMTIPSFEPADHRSAGLLRRVFSCDVAALVTVRGGEASTWLLMWPVTTSGTGNRSPVTRWTRCDATPPLTQAVAATVWTEGVELTPGPPAVRCQLVIPLPAAGGGTATWYLGRESCPFSPEEVEHATVLAPGLCSRLDLGAPPSQQPAFESLTVREQEVLQLVAVGLTSGAIARRCNISERTVHKHLQHIYRKIGCQDRLSAVLRVRDAGLLTL